MRQASTLTKMTYQFKDVEFLTAKEKELILRSWTRFLKNGLRKEDFTKRLYEHLHLHCGFIAHYDIHGFYSTYFTDITGKERFFDHLFGDYNQRCQIDDYKDIQEAMYQVYQEYKEKYASQVKDDIKERIELLKACIERAEKDQDFAKEFLTKLGY